MHPSRIIRFALAAAGLLGATLACNLGGAVDPTVAAPTPAPPPSPTVAPEPTATVDPRSLCPSETSDSRQHFSLENGYCFLYPAHYDLTESSFRPDEVVTLLGPVADPDAIESIAVVLSVAHNGPDQGMTPEEYAERWVELHAFTGPTPREGFALGDHSAVLVRNIPSGFASGQQAFTVANGYRYSVFLNPQPAEVPPLTEEAELAWSTVTGSIVFFPPVNERTYLRAEDVCSEPTAGTQLYTSLLDGYCLHFPADFEIDTGFPAGRFVGGPILDTVDGFGEVRTSLTFGTFGSFPGSTPREVLAPRLDLIDADSVIDLTIGGHPAVAFRDPRGPWTSRGAMIVVDGFVYTIVAQPWEPERWPEGIDYLERVWETVIGSAAFFDMWN